MSSKASLRLKLIVALLCAALLIVVAVWPLHTGVRDLTVAILEAAAATLVTFIGLVLLYLYLGSPPTDQIAQATAEATVQRLGMSIATPPASPSASSGGPRLYSTWADVPWQELLSKGRDVEIVVNYFDRWLNEVQRPLVDLLRRQGTVTIYLPNPDRPDDDSALRCLAELYPDHELQNVRDKIVRTGMRLSQRCREAGVPPQRARVRFVDNVLAYAAIRIDGTSVLVSVYDQFRQSSRVQSPAIEINTTAEPELDEFWSRQFDGFASVGAEAPIDALAKKWHVKL